MAADLKIAISAAGSLAGVLVSISFMALVVYLMNSTMQLYFMDWADRHGPRGQYEGSL